MSSSRVWCTYIIRQHLDRLVNHAWKQDRHARDNRVSIYRERAAGTLRRTLGRGRGCGQSPLLPRTLLERSALTQFNTIYSQANTYNVSERLDKLHNHNRKGLCEYDDESDSLYVESIDLVLDPTLSAGSSMSNGLLRQEHVNTVCANVLPRRCNAIELR